MNLSKIHHIAIIVSDYEAAKDFYVNNPCIIKTKPDCYVTEGYINRKCMDEC